MTAVFFDTSVLLAGLIDTGAGHAAAHRAMAAIGSPPLARPSTAFHCCLEFFAVATRLPERLRLEPEQAARLLEEEILDRFDVRQLPPTDLRALLRRAAGERIHGGRLYDTHIAEIARSAGASTFVTGNRRHFEALAGDGVEVIGVEELAERLPDPSNDAT